MNEGSHYVTLSITDLEQDSGDAALPEDGPPSFTAPVSIRVISYRKHNHDPDGVSVKAVLDGLVAANLLPDDSARQVKEVTFVSRKSKVEKTIIEIEGET